jgi:3-hydroxyacyl-[acyl-carrier-protein] dehydratase
VTSKDLIFDYSQIDLNHVIADLAEIRQHNQQRYEMEQLTAIVYADVDKKIAVGYKDITDQEFWVRGHMPGMPLMPGVVMLEAAAQLCSFFCHKYNLLGDVVVGFGGLEDVRFRDPVFPGDRLVLMCEMLKVRIGRMIVCRFQGVVHDKIVVEGILKGVPIPVEALAKPMPKVP